MKIFSIGDWHNMKIFFDLSHFEEYYPNNERQLNSISLIKNHIIPFTYEYFNQIFKVREINKIEKSIDPKKCPIKNFKFKESGLSYDFYMIVKLFDNFELPFIGLSINCSNNKETNRPTIGVMEINIFFLDPNKNLLIFMYKYTLIHETMHSLGFTNNSIPLFIDKNLKLLSTSNILKKENGLFYYKSDRIIKLSKKHFNCNFIDKIKFEDNGTKESKGQHWEFNELGYEIMDAIINYGMRISDFTFSFFEDSGWYKLDFDFSQKLLWGNNKGCEFFQNQNSEPEFCNSDDYCSINYLGKSECSKSTFSNKKKINLTNSSYCNIDHSKLNNNKHDNRCFVKKKSKSFEPYCYKSFCKNNGKTLVFINENNEKIICLKQGELTYKGDIYICPNIEKFCELRYECKNSCNGKGLCYNGNCLCFLGYKGIACEYKYEQKINEICKNNCNNNGICINGKCNCFDNYEGEFCKNIINDIGSFGSNCSKSLYIKCYKKLNDKILFYKLNFINQLFIFLIILLIK